jgi:SlyX protein
MSDAIVELQTQLSFQERTIAELNAALTDQQRQIDRLRAELKLLREQLGGIEDRLDATPAQEKPPHY